MTKKHRTKAADLSKSSQKVKKTNKPTLQTMGIAHLPKAEKSKKKYKNSRDKKFDKLCSELLTEYAPLFERLSKK